jgi:hypothetical protein
MSPRVAATTSGERPKTLKKQTPHQDQKSGNRRIRILTSLGNLTDTGILVVKSGDKSKRFTSEVGLEVDRSLGEEGPLTCIHGVEDEPGPILFDEPGFDLTVNDVQELGRSGMGVRGIHSARSGEWFVRVRKRRGEGWALQDLRQLADSHGHPVGKERREVGDIGDGEASAGIFRGTNSGIEIEQPLTQIRRSAAKSRQ